MPKGNRLSRSVASQERQDKVRLKKQSALIDMAKLQSTINCATYHNKYGESYSDKQIANMKSELRQKEVDFQKKHYEEIYHQLL